MNRGVVAIISRKNSNNKDEFLLVKPYTDFGEFTGYFYPPGGHLEKGETIIQTLIRELKEELNLDIKPIKKLTELPSDRKDIIVEWWSAEIIGGQMKLQKDEIEEARYFTKEEMNTVPIWPATKKFFKTYIFNNT